MTWREQTRPARPETRVLLRGADAERVREWPWDLCHQSGFCCACEELLLCGEVPGVEFVEPRSRLHRDLAWKRREEESGEVGVVLHPGEVGRDEIAERLLRVVVPAHRGGCRALVGRHALDVHRRGKRRLRRERVEHAAAREREGVTDRSHREGRVAVYEKLTRGLGQDPLAGTRHWSTTLEYDSRHGKRGRAAPRSRREDGD